MQQSHHLGEHVQACIFGFISLAFCSSTRNLDRTDANVIRSDLQLEFVRVTNSEFAPFMTTVVIAIYAPWHADPFAYADVQLLKRCKLQTSADLGPVPLCICRG